MVAKMTCKDKRFVWILNEKTDCKCNAFPIKDQNIYIYTSSLLSRKD